MADAKKSGDDSKNTVKIGVAVVMLLLAGLVLAWNFGAFDPDPKKQAEQAEAALPPEKKIERDRKVEEAKKIDDEYKKKPGATKVGG